jgi:hypothetical protein
MAVPRRSAADLLPFAHVVQSGLQRGARAIPRKYLNKQCPESILTPTQDEFFHVPQAQKYCEGDYTWDPKITTPPGL